MDDHILDLVFENGEEVFRDSWGFATGRTRRVSDDRFEVYKDGELVMYAISRTPPIIGFPYVEFYDRLGHELGTARVFDSFCGRKVEYYDRLGNRVAERYVDERTVSEKKAEKEKQKTRQGGSSGGNRDRSESSGGGTVSPPPPGNDGGGSVPPGPASEFFAGIKAIFILLASLGVAISAFFCLLYDYWHIIFRVFSFICVFVPVPLMMLIFILKCHDEGASPEQSRFFNTQLFLLAGCFLLVSVLHFFLFFYHLSPVNVDSFGFFLFSFAPCVLHGIASCISIHPLSQRDRMHYWDIADTAALLACIGNVAFVFLANCAGGFDESFSTAPTFSDAFLFAMLVCIIALVCIVSGLVARIPYWLLRKVL